MHHKVASISSGSQASFIRTGTQRAAYLGSVPNQPGRAPAPKQNNSMARGSLKHGHSTSKKKLNPAMSTSAITGSSAGSKSMQKSSKMGTTSTMSYEPVLIGPQSHEAPSKKQSSISMTAGNVHKQPAQVGKSKIKYLSPVLR